MGYWEFNLSEASNVRVEVTQRDQFNNDEVGLAEALVREAIQNSSDAPAGNDPVNVRFSLRTVTGSDAKKFASQLGSLRPHLSVCGVDPTIIDSDVIRVLAIEDFNTSGLTGSFEEVDHGNFDRFWRAVGEPGKKGKDLGRWGLGKIVYSSASAIKAFYGLTVSIDHPTPSFMGQVVLKNHRLGPLFYPAHGFFFEGRSAALKLQLPIQEPAEVDSFRNFAGLMRSTQQGLSVVVPYLVDGIDEPSLISGVVNNYYFPILAGRLLVEVGETPINKSNFLKIAESHSGQQIPFNFVKEISDSIDSVPDLVISQPIGNNELDASFFTGQQIAVMKQRFAAGQLVRVRIPVLLKPKMAPDTISYIDLYLRCSPEGEKTFALIARRSLTLPGERKYFGMAAAYGALIANDYGVASFLGDAENPAHTAWNSNAENLKKGWRSPQGTLSAIRHSLRQLCGLVAEQTQTEDAEALIDFFNLLEKTQADKGKKKKTSKPKIEVKPAPKAISIRPRKGGFDVIAGPAAATWAFPRTIRIRVAYDMIGANPFKRHSPFDFDFTKDSDFAIAAKDAICNTTKSNILTLIAETKDFRLSVGGFDERRDLVVDARAL